MKSLSTYLLLFFSFGSQAQIGTAITQVLTPSTPADSIVSSGGSFLFCPGETIQLTVFGGELGSGARWTWYLDGCGIGPSIDTGVSIFVNPVDSVSRYYCTATGGCNMPCTQIVLSIDTLGSGCSPLPLHIMSFNAVLYKETKGLITWEAAEEEKGTKYDLSKSLDGRKFAFIAHLDAKASRGINIYNYIDGDLNAGRNYYRLKITYPDQSVLYSLVKMIKYQPREDIVKLYPVPTDKWIYFEFEGKENQEVQIWTSNILGQSSQKRMVVYPEEGRNIVKMDLSDLAQGAYLFHYQNSNGRSEVLKFVKTD